MTAIKWRSFLKDVFISSLGAYGGPASHYGVFTSQLIDKKKYITEEDLIELIALCSILPGPTSTQTIVSIGYKIGGPILALLTMLVWALPVLVVMTALAFLYTIFEKFNISTNSLRFIGPMAVSFIILASFKIGRKVVKDKLTLALLIVSGVTTYFIRTPWIFPLILIGGGAISTIESKETELWNHVKLNPPWKFLISFIILAVGSFTGALLLDIALLDNFERFYRYGYLIFGGGQVVVPVMHTELVEVRSLLSNQEFLTGYGLVQGLPGPMFSFSAYAGGMASRGYGTLYQILGSIISGVGIFLPGLLLIYFIYPVWEKMKQIKGIKVSLRGVNAVAGGLITASGIILLQKSGLSLENLVITLITLILLISGKVPAPLIVVLTIFAGFIL